MGVVVAIVVVFVLSVNLWYHFMQLESDPGRDMITVNLASPQVIQLSGNGFIWWDAILNINKITPWDAGVMWNGVFMVVTSATGSVLNAATSLRPDLSDYDDGADGTIDVEFWYIETGGDTHPSAGDAIRITGMTSDYEGAYIVLEFRGNRIGSATLPTNFP